MRAFAAPAVSAEFSERGNDIPSQESIAKHDARTPAAEALLSDGGVISVEVLNELAAVAHRKLDMSWPDITDALDAIRALCPLPMPVTEGIHDAALRLAAQHDFDICDALIVAAALEANDCRRSAIDQARRSAIRSSHVPPISSTADFPLISHEHLRHR